jgi:hypothetical protein
MESQPTNRHQSAVFATTPRGKQATQAAVLETLMAEIYRYLAAVDLFRECGCRPRWRRESE